VLNPAPRRSRGAGHVSRVRGNGYTARMRSRLTFAWMVFAALLPAGAAAQVKATLPKGPMTPAWDKGIQPISQASYWNAVECGKQGGQRPLCVFYDADLCKNEDYTLALFTPYKQVAYEVWQAVRAKQEPPTPSYGDAQRTRITLGVTPVAGSKNPLTAVAIKRGAQVVKPSTQSFDAGGGRFIFDFPAFAPTAAITIEMTGKTRTISCSVDQGVLARFR
jgi:hypothetical protein